MAEFDLQVLLPIHNEAESISGAIHEIYNAISPVARVQFILCEDGSQDNTKEILTQLAKQIPAKLLIGDQRKGYSRAVIDGMRQCTAPYLLCLDSDGQCDPKDFGKFWPLRDRADLVVGWRVERADNWMRKAMSRTFYRFYKALYHVPLHDPSCPFVLAHQDTIASVVDQLGEMKQGFWWEFMARCHRSGRTILELPVHHRLRTAGVTQVYKLSKLPGIGYHHFVALFKIWFQTRKPRRLVLRSANKAANIS